MSSLRPTNRLHVNRQKTYSVVVHSATPHRLFGTIYHLNSPKTWHHSPPSRNISRPIFTVNLSAADHVTHPHLRFDSYCADIGCVTNCVLLLLLLLRTKTGYRSRNTRFHGLGLPVLNYLLWKERYVFNRNICMDYMKFCEKILCKVIYLAIIIKLFPMLRTTCNGWLFISVQCHYTHSVILYWCTVNANCYTRILITKKNNNVIILAEARQMSRLE